MDTDSQHRWLKDVLDFDSRSAELASDTLDGGADAGSHAAETTLSPPGAPVSASPAPQATGSAATGSQSAPAAPEGYVYHQTSGELTLDGKHVATGHSGDGPGRNNPPMEGQRDVGPVPKGSYSISQQFESKKTGPGAMRLSPLPGTDTHGRSAFEVHGGSSKHPDHDSTGCIILPPDVRGKMAGKTLQVVP